MKRTEFVGESGTSCGLKAKTLGPRNWDSLANPSNAAPQTFFFKDVNFSGEEVRVRVRASCRAR